MTDLGGVLIGAAALVTSTATLVTALRTHKAVRMDNGKTIGETVTKIAEQVNGETHQ